MITAFVLIDTEVGRGGEVLEKLKKMEVIKEGYLLDGKYYDLVIKMEGENESKVKEIVREQIRKIDGVSSTATHIVVENWAKVH